MKASKVYPNPPIQEAVIEIKFDPDSSKDVSAIENLAQSIDEELTVWGKNIRIQTRIDNYGKQEQQRVVGVAMRDQASKRSLHLDIDRIAYTLLENYTSWDAFEKAFLGYWSALQSLWDSNMHVKRVGVRFINKINLQITNLEELNKYTTANFDIHTPAGNLHPDIQEALARTILPFDDLQCIIVKVLLRNKEYDTFDLVLDIDVSQSPNKAIDVSALRTCLQRLRNLKNEVFESNITNDTRELFQ